MGPRPNGRGKSGRALPRASITSRVNGAAAKRPRKGVATVTCLYVSFLRQWGRGQTAAESSRRDPQLYCQGRVNGAAAKRPRKAVGEATEQGYGFASMGPRPNGRGKRACRRALRLRRPASMGPRPNGRGKIGVIGGIIVYVLASMGPRPNGRGKTALASKAPVDKSRQWGRGQTAAESSALLLRPSLR